MPKTFPTNNRADSLKIDFFYLRRRIGDALGYGYHHAEWDDTQEQEVLETMDEGLMMYYYPDPLPPPYALNMTTVHEWSFMRPWYEMKTAANQRRYPLPSTFERPISDLYFAANENDYYDSIPFTSSTRLQRLETRQEEQSPPRWAATQPADSAGEDVQTQELVLHPTPDSAYFLKFQFQAIARRLTEAQPHPLGGQIHGPGILAACLCAAETKRTGGHGPAYQIFIERLAGNIIRDHQRGPSFLGYNGNSGTNQFFSRADARAGGGVFLDDVKYGTWMD